MINKARFGIAYIIGAIGMGIMLLAVSCLTKAQREKTKKLLLDVERVLDDREELIPECTIEDEIFSACTNVYKDCYDKGTNEDLTVECRMCGVNTKRGDYYKRNDLIEPDSTLPYLFICPDCYNSLMSRTEA